MTQPGPKAQVGEAGEDLALVVYHCEPEAQVPNHPHSHPRTADVDERLIVPPASRKAYMEVLRTNWFHLKSDEYLRADSVQCPNCLRRFCPDRINSHERVCFKKINTVPGEPVTLGANPGPGRVSPLVECRLCGKKFGTRSIAIHEPQCLKKHGQAQGSPGKPPPNSALDKTRDCMQLEGPRMSKPLAIEFPTPGTGPSTGPSTGPGPGAVRNRPRTTQPAPQHLNARIDAPSQPKSAWVGEHGVEVGSSAASAREPSSTSPQALTILANKKGTGQGGSSSASKPTRKPRSLRCYLCGQPFGLQSLPIHEPQCLAKWRLENARLPPNLQRPEPQKPEFIFTAGHGEKD